MMVLLYILIGLASIFIGFINLNPQFGSNPSIKQKKFYSTFDNYINNEFINLEKTIMVTADMPMSEFFKRDSNRVPQKNIQYQNINIESFIINNENSIKFSWLGHSAFLLNINGKLIMLDPMLGNYASPLPISTLKRFSPNNVLSLENIDTIDAVIFSHDHYDHLDYSTIKKIKDKVNKYFVPLGLGNHLMKWGINPESITELNWNQSIQFEEIEFICLPSRHFSGRGPFNRNSTLWSSWAIMSEYGKIYFSGDSGYGKHFKEIGNKYGPFDVVFIDSGQYNKAWKHSHMFPEEAVFASQDLNAKYFMPIHWGAFTLSTHPWNEPIKKSIDYSYKYNQTILAPQIGEIVILDNINEKQLNWWSE